MTFINSNRSIDLYRLNRFANRYLLNELCILIDINDTLRNDPKFSEIFEKYENLSKILSTDEPRPRFSELASEFSFWHPSVLVSQTLKNSLATAGAFVS